MRSHKQHPVITSTGAVAEGFYRRLLDGSLGLNSHLRTSPSDFLHLLVSSKLSDF